MSILFRANYIQHNDNSKVRIKVLDASNQLMCMQNMYLTDKKNIINAGSSVVANINFDKVSIHSLICFVS